MVEEYFRFCPYYTASKPVGVITRPAEELEREVERDAGHRG
jgi:hypothetical protein